MTHGVVDALEAIHVDHHDGRQAAVRLGARGSPQRFIEHRAVRQAGERIEVRHATNLFARRVKFTDISPDGEHGFHGAVRPEFGRQPDHVAERLAAPGLPLEFELTIGRGREHLLHLPFVDDGVGSAGKFGWLFAEYLVHAARCERYKRRIDIEAPKIAAVAGDCIGRVFDERSELSLPQRQFARLFLEAFVEI